MESDQKASSAIDPPAPLHERTGSHNSHLPKNVESLLARIFLLLTSFIICIIAIELLARFYLWNVATEDEFRLLASIRQIKARYGEDVFVQKEESSHPSWSPHYFLGYFPTPNYRRGANRHNSFGFRGREFSLSKPANTYRIVALGASTTYSLEVADFKHSYPNLLEQYLRESGFAAVEVINASAAGYTSHQNLINMQFRVLPLQPDLIILYQGFNDISARFVYPSSQYLGDRSGSLRPFVRGIFMPDITEYSTALRILGIRAGITVSHSALEWHRLSRPNSYVGDQFIQQIQSGVYPSGIFVETSAAEMLANNPPVHFERNLAQMIALADHDNVNILLVTMVLDEDFHETTGVSLRRFYTSDEYVLAMAEHNESTRRIALSTGTPIFDLTEAFPDDATLFTDGLHMNEDGNRKRAQLIGDFIIRQFSEDMQSAAASR